jgi:methyl-CpG-binding domain protein 4
LAIVAAHSFLCTSGASRHFRTTVSAQALGSRHPESKTMAKRKHNQSSAVGPGQTDVQSPSKKAKLDREQANAPSHQPPANSKSSATMPESKRQAPDATLPSPASHEGATPGLSKSALKRHRKTQRLREAKKKSHSGDKVDLSTKEAGNSSPSQKPLTDPVSVKSKPSHPNTGSKPSSKGLANNVKTRVAKSGPDRLPPAKGIAAGKKSASKTKNSDSVKQNPTLQQSNVPASQVATKAPPGAKAGFSKKRERRRQKIALWKRDQAAGGDPESKREQEDLGQNALDQDTLPSSAKGAPTKYDSPDDTSTLRQTTQTTLLPAPKKQWIDETEQDLPAGDANLRKEVSQTSLMPRPAKEWVEDGAPIHAGDAVNDSSSEADVDEDIPADATDASPSAAKAKSTRSSPASSAHSSPSSSPKDLQPTEAERPFATVGLPPITQPSATRPGINTIASFSLSSRRHPVDVLAKGRRVSGLSGMRMDTGSVGAANKPVSSLKASSVPSYSGRGDVKAAFAAFNKFAHGGESSDSDDESDESDSEVEAEVNKPATTTAVAPVVVPSVTTEVRAPQNSQDGGAGQPDSTAHTDNSTKSDSDSLESSSDGENATAESDHEVSKSHETQENEECVAETPSNFNPDDPNTLEDAHDGVEDISPQPSGNTPRMLGQKDLPLFSDFKAKHNMQSTDDSIEPPDNFLGQDLGGNVSGSGPSSGSIASDQHTSSLQVPIGDYQASQEADDLYRSIEDISREVFGSTRTLPDCKPLSNSLDTASEPFVTEIPSGHGVDFQSLQQKTPDKDVASRHIVRGSSPMVYIVGGVDVVGEAMPDGSRLGDDDERGTEGGGPDLVDKKAETEPYGSPESSLSTLTASPAPHDGTPSPEETSMHAAQEHDKIEGDATNEPVDDPLEANELMGSDEKKKRKMTGTSSKHFSPRKQPSRQVNTSVKPESIDDTEPSALEGLEEHPELPPPSGDVSNPTKRKGTGKTSSFFTPTSSPVKPTTTPKSKSKTPRVPAGTSTCPVPPTTSAHFGLIQEKLWQTPFWLLIAVTFLNKTTGRSAVPIFRSLQSLYPTPEDLAQARHEDLVDLIASLGLQNQRAKKLVGIAKTWCENPPVKGRRYRCLHYPSKGDGKEYKKDEVIEDDSDEEDEEEEEGGSSDDVRGALEIAHISGCGPYAWDSWRIFCRDVLRGRAQDYNCKGAADPGSFVPEWRRVLPLDKELRACLRWMWLREGWVWDCESGAKRAATEEERRAGELGEMRFGDEGEERFARDAAAATAAVGDGDGDVRGVGESGVGNDDVGEVIVEGVVAHDVVVPVTPATKKTKMTRSKMSIARRELDVVSGDEVQMSVLRRSRRNRAG